MHVITSAADKGDRSKMSNIYFISIRLITRGDFTAEQELCDSGWRSTDYEYYCLLGCSIKSSGRCLPMFHRNVLLPFWDRWTSNKLHGITFRKTSQRLLVAWMLSNVPIMHYAESTFLWYFLSRYSSIVFIIKSWPSWGSEKNATDTPISRVHKAFLFKRGNQVRVEAEAT